ncbi:MAG: proton-conducting transporter membrane subunit [candidate division KSB1 bacterium]|nr:proton-conducting transporter membrane subunit [candidate division KSB1 bacterium]MDZ7346178.1 proton-conducting transporter membrane subunit [candidate division KSB1 bacterium]
MPALLLLVPFAAGTILVLVSSRLLNRLFLLGTALLYLFIIFVSGSVFEGKDTSWGQYFQLDGLGYFFLSVLAVVYAAAALYSLYYFDEHGLTPRREALYSSALLFFLGAMAGVLTASHAAMLWVFMEATTLTSALLIYYEQQKASLEAAWKYIYICSVGIALAFVGIILLSIAGKTIGSLFFSNLYRHAAEMNHFWLKLSFVFILVGFGTKIGLAPMHAWLPDAHSEAPSAVSALLSGALLNTAFVGLLRIYKLMSAAGLKPFADKLMLGTGFLSLLVGAVFMLRVGSFKRMLAYSSIENMGLLVISATLGKQGITAMLLQSIGHSFSKAGLFLTSGNILHLYKTKKIDQIHDLAAKEKISATLWLLFILAISGLPPFPSFWAKFILVASLINAGFGTLLAPFFIFLIYIFYAMTKTSMKMLYGGSSKEHASASLPILAYLPQLILLLLLFLIGVLIPDRLTAMIDRIAAYFN